VAQGRGVLATGLGDIGDVAVDGAGTAYTTDFAGARLLAVDLSSGSSRPVAGVPGAYGVALDGAGTAYVVNWSGGQLFAVDLRTGEKKTVATGLPGGISGVTLDGTGKADVGQREGSGKVFEVDLADGNHRVVADLAGASTARLELDGTGKAYTVDHSGGRLYEVTLADGAQRVVATGLGTCEGLALDLANGQIYVSNRQGQLWRISHRAARALGGVGMVVAPEAQGA
jgi:sugar lactone lactonase YvrE